MVLNILVSIILILPLISLLLKREVDTLWSVCKTQDASCHFIALMSSTQLCGSIKFLSLK